MQREPASLHRCTVFGSPWAGVHGTLTESARHYGRHWHEAFGLGLIDKGGQRSASGRGAVEACAGDLIATNPGEIHDGRPLGGEPRRWRMVYLDERLANEAAEVDRMPWLPPVLHDPLLRAALVRLVDRLARWQASARSAPADALACDEALAMLGARLAGVSAANPLPAVRPAADRHVRSARERLADASREAPSLSALAQDAGLSKYQLLRRFEQAYGLTPFAWLLQRRAEHARGLIAGGRALADAAADSGFADQSHMTRVFVQRFGYTPGAWASASR